MILSAHQPVYLPWLGLFHKIALADHFISFDQVQFVPKDWISRNRILTPKGPIWLSVPCQKKGRFDSTISETLIDNTNNWRRKHWNSIHFNYAKAKFFKKYADFLEDTYQREWTHLVDLNAHILAWAMAELGIKVPVESAGKYDFKGEKSALVLDMCHQLKADLYIFGALGRDYADLEAFEKGGVQVEFQDYKHPQYPQMHDGFEPYMSFLDILFNCGPGSFDILMSNNISHDMLLTHLKG